MIDSDSCPDTSFQRCHWACPTSALAIGCTGILNNFQKRHWSGSAQLYDSDHSPRLSKATSLGQRCIRLMSLSGLPHVRLRFLSHGYCSAPRGSDLVCRWDSCEWITLESTAYNHLTKYWQSPVAWTGIGESMRFVSNGPVLWVQSFPRVLTVWSSLLGAVADQGGCQYCWLKFDWSMISGRRLLMLENQQTLRLPSFRVQWGLPSI